MLLALLVACRHVPTEAGATCAPAPDAADATATALAGGPVSAKFTIHIERGDQTINAQGALLISPPSALRLEVSGPVGPPQLVVTSDGTRTAVWQAGARTLYEANDAPGLLGLLTGGAIGPEAITAVLLARVPALPPSAISNLAGTTWTLPEGGPLVEIGASCTNPDWLNALTVRRADRPALLDVHGVTAKGRWQTLSFGIAPLNLRADLVFDTWKPATPGSSAFDLRAPPNATVIDLGQMLALIPSGTTTPAPAPP